MKIKPWRGFPHCHPLTRRVIHKVSVIYQGYSLRHLRYDFNIWFIPFQMFLLTSHLTNAWAGARERLPSVACRLNFVYSIMSSLTCTSLRLLALLSAKLNFRIPSFSISLSHFRLFQTLNKHVLTWCDGGTRTHDLLLKRQIKH